MSTIAGQSATAHITFIPTPGVTTPITLACSNLPAKSTCSIAPATIAAASAQTDVVVTVKTTASTSAAIAHPRVFYALLMPFTGFGLVGIALLIPRTRRRTSVTIVTLLVLGLAMFIAACGDSRHVATYNGTPKGAYTVTVTGTSTSVTQSTTFSLTVT